MNTPAKQQLLQQIAAIPAMERGTLSAYSFKERSGHSGPYYKLQCWQAGKNLTRYVPSDELAAVQAAVGGYARYQQLTRQYAELVIAETRQSIAGSKKNEIPGHILLAQNEEIQQLIARFDAQSPQPELVAQLEPLLRIAVFKTANELVGWLLQQAVDRIDQAYQPKPGQICKGRDPLNVQGMFGSFPLQRDYYYDPVEGLGHYPADDALGLEGSYTPALTKLVCLEGADEPTYLTAERHLLQTAGISISARQIQRVVQRVGTAAQQWQERPAQPAQCERRPVLILYISADGTGIPMVPEELVGRKGKPADGKAKTRQVYLGCVFTQHGVDEKGRPVRDWDSTTYLSSFKSIDEFGPLLRQHALWRGMGSANQVVLLIDGAHGLENMGRQNFKDAGQIVDFYHALEHAGLVLVALLGKDHPDQKKRLGQWARKLLKDKVLSLIEETRQECAGKPNATAVEEALHYFVSNVSRMQYGTFRAAGYFIGSGVVEAGCKTVIGRRCKQSGMFWSEPGAENILALRCIHSSRRLDEFWKDRLNARAALNDCLPLAA